MGDNGFSEFTEEARLRAALREILEYEPGFYSSDKNPAIRAIKRIAEEALYGKRLSDQLGR